MRKSVFQKLLKSLDSTGFYDTRNYRYFIDGEPGSMYISRIPIWALGRTCAPDEWCVLALQLPNGEWIF